MRQAFTLIELMIVIAIIAIIAAIAVPNLLESRINANESAAAASLKSGIFPGQVQFQSGGYADPVGEANPNGVGSYAFDHLALAGGTGGAGSGLPLTALQLLGPEWNVADGNDHSGYLFWVYADSDGTFTGGTDRPGEQYWFATASPTQWNDTGRRSFAITQSGSVYMTTAAASATATVGAALNVEGKGVAVTQNLLAMTDPLIANPTLGSATNGANGVAYRK